MTKQDKPWVVEFQDKKLGLLPESSHSSITKVLGSFPKRLSGVTGFWIIQIKPSALLDKLLLLCIKAGGKVWRIHKEATK